MLASNFLADLNWVKSKEWPAFNGRRGKPLSVVDLFCGCGALTLGAHEAARINGRRFQLKLAVDISQTAVDVVAQNFPTHKSKVRCADIEQLFDGPVGNQLTNSEIQIAESCGNVDLLLAGPPCQGHSDLNNSSRRNDERNRLYLIAARAIEVLHPKAILFENVPTVVHDKLGVVAQTRDLLERAGYSVAEMVCDLEAMGIPQRRKRHILLGHKADDFTLPQQFGEKPNSSLQLSSVLADIRKSAEKNEGVFSTPSRMSAENLARVNYLFENDVYDLPNELRPKCHKDNNHSYKSMYGRLRWDKPAQTITTGFGSMGQGRFIHPKERRVITPHEAARIQGLPDFFSFAGVDKRGQLQELIGNAVPPQLSANIADRLIKAGAI